jgi:hypothetical protein
VGRLNKMAKWPLLWRKDNVGWSRCCIDQTGMAAWVLASRFAAGESIADIAADMRVGAEAVEQAVQLWVRAAGGFNGERVEARMADMLRKDGRDFSELEDAK